MVLHPRGSQLEWVIFGDTFLRERKGGASRPSSSLLLFLFTSMSRLILPSNSDSCLRTDARLDVSVDRAFNHVTKPGSNGAPSLPRIGPILVIRLTKPPSGSTSAAPNDKSTR